MTAEERQAVIEDGELEAVHRGPDRRATAPNHATTFTTFLLEAELDGNKLEDDHVAGTMVLLMIAGIDTTWSAIGASLWHLAQHPDDRRRLAAEPALMGHPPWRSSCARTRR